MKTFLGLLLAAFGVMLLIHSLGAYDALASRVSQIASGATMDRTGWMLVGGMFAVLLGVAISGHHRRGHPKT